MSNVKLTEAEDRFLCGAAAAAARGEHGYAASTYGATTQALLRRGLIEKAHRPLWSGAPRRRPTASGYAWLGLEPPHE